ncbi:sigma-70 family RNA polymerase sigma factor [Microlunatus soli]|nr:sigma-70 family RNA polymerase sigma factor [Microlunatus soli]
MVQQAQAGEPGAVEDLLAEVEPLVAHYCRTRLGGFSGGRESADDVIQESLLAVYNALPRYVDRGAPFAAWVYGICSRKVADAQRGAMRAPTPVAELPETIDTAPGPEDHLLNNSAIDQLRDLLQHLPERTRTVLMMRAEGISAESTGDRLGLSAGSVRVAYHRGLNRLRQLVAR